MVRKSKEETDIANELEQIQVAVLSIKTSNNQNISKDSLQNEFRKYFDDINITGEGPFYYKTKNNRYKISEDGLVTIILGNSNEITPNDYGKYVEYVTPNSASSTNDFPLYPQNGKWQIFYADDENIYLIATDNIGNKGLNNFNSNYTNSNGAISLLLNNEIEYPSARQWLKGFINPQTKKYYESNCTNIQSVLYLLDSGGIWNKNYKNEFAEYTIGGPTLEMLCASYNKVNHQNLKATANYNSKISNDSLIEWYGYTQTIDSGLTSKTFWNNNQFDYWLACPAVEHGLGIYYVENNLDRLNYCFYNQSSIGFRPIICLKSNVKINWNSLKNSYELNF